MTITVSQVRAWAPQSLRATQKELESIVERVDGQRASVLDEQDVLAETWRGDAATAAASRVVTECAQIDGMSTGVAEGMKNAAIGSVDDVAHNIGRGFGAFGSILGTIPAIKNDIDGGMDPTKAIVTESVGTLAGVGAAALSGAAVGSVFPGIGTIGGVVVGLVVGGAAAYGTTKKMQQEW